MKNIAVITFDFSAFSGSSIVALEVANYFGERGHNVVVRAERFSDAYTPFLHENVSVSSRRLDIADFDVVWSQHGHFSINTRNLDDLRRWKGVFISSHLSSLTPAEVYHYPFSSKYAGAVVFNAEKVEEDLTSKFDVRGVKCNLKNSAPKHFRKIDRGLPHEISSILVVSNHLPQEVESAIDILESRGVSVSRLGIGGVRRLIRPEDIQGADAVLTIGKTVQYSLVGGRPVYCYDFFGGPGWISDRNFEEAERQNFSGRCSPEGKDACRIADELIIGYPAAREFSQENALSFQERYSFEAKMDELMARVETAGHGNFFDSPDCAEDVDLMRGALLHVDWIWRDVFSMKEEYEEKRLKAIQCLSTSWFMGLLLQPWNAKHWNSIRLKQRKYRRELKKKTSSRG